MNDFKTLWDGCEKLLVTDGQFEWPEGVTSVNYPGKKDKTLKKGGT